MKAQQKKPRASISFPVDVYEKLERIADDKRVSLAWVVREATERYVAEQYVSAANSKAEPRK